MNKDGGGTWNRTRGWRNQNPLPYRLAIPLYIIVTYSFSFITTRPTAYRLSGIGHQFRGGSEQTEWAVHYSDPV